MIVTDKDQFDRVVADIQKKAAEREERLPTTIACLEAIHEAGLRLRDLGWKSTVMSHPPKTGETFIALEFGSTGVFRCKWLGSSFFVEDDEDLWPARPVLWRPWDEKLWEQYEQERIAAVAEDQKKG